MSNSSPKSASVKEVPGYLAAELERARTLLAPDQWQALLVGVSDQGEIAAFRARGRCCGAFCEMKYALHLLALFEVVMAVFLIHVDQNMYVYFPDRVMLRQNGNT